VKAAPNKPLLVTGAAFRVSQFSGSPSGMANGDGFLVGVLGDDAGIEGAHGGVVLHGAEARHPQIAADQIVAAPAHDVALRSAWLAVAIDAAGRFDGKTPK
jgi:hypothetical protein